MTLEPAEELLLLTRKLLDAIAAGNWEAYAELCDPSLTAVEPEALGHLVEGLEFHRFYFQLATGARKPHHTICAPRVRVMGDAAVVTYFRLTQYVDEQGNPQSRGTEETRVWQRIDGKWRHVHFHRSTPAN
jgi:calcium/calmodulin-dependent protein kinase (CaM kinase) II